MDVHLSRPLNDRLDYIAQYFNSTSTQDLQVQFSNVICNIFDMNCDLNWNLLSLTKGNDFSLFEKAYNFLRPNGVLLTTINNKLADSTHKYEFPIDRLSEHTQLSIRRATVQPFYLNKMEFQKDGQSSSNLSLNAFEFYFFNFYYLVNHKKFREMTIETAGANSLYFALAVEYFNHYLITEPHSGKVPCTPANHHHHTRTNPIISPSSRFNTYSVNANRGLLTNIDHQQDPISRQRPLEMTDLWQTGTILQLSIEFWVNTASLESNTMKTRFEYSFLMHASNVLPTTDQVMLVRILLKYIYYFLHGQIFNQPISSATQQNFLNRLEEYKKSIISTYLQQTMIQFFNICFEHWPYDTSFRLVLETWLTFIQPWRYVDKPVHDTGDDSSTFHISDEWLPFIQEQYYFYSTYFFQFLQRAQKIDLGVDRNAALLYRVMKVFSNGSFRQLLRSAEDRLRRTVPLSPALPFSSSRLVSQQVYHSVSYLNDNPDLVLLSLPGGIRIISLWSSLVISETEKLTALIMTAMRRLADLSNMEVINRESSLRNNANHSRSWWSCFNDIFGLNGVTSLEWPRNEKEEREKCEYYLRQASENMKTLFQCRDITPPSGSPQHYGDSFTTLERPLFVNQTSTPKSESMIPDCCHTPKGTSLTPEGRVQLLRGQRRFKYFEFSGDPDFQPVRSFEVEILVRACQELSDYLSQQYLPTLRSLCMRRGFIGKWARHILLLDVPLSLRLDSSMFSPVSERQLQLRNEPRIRLRFLANKRLLFAMVITYAIFNSVFGLKSIGLFFILITLFALLYSLVQMFFIKD